MDRFHLEVQIVLSLSYPQVEMAMVRTRRQILDLVALLKIKLDRIFKLLSRPTITVSLEV
jgi:hypothetical protein